MQQLIFAKPPIPGKVKTRLAAFTGNQFATDLYRAILEDVLSAFCFPSVNIPLSLYLTEEDHTGYFANRFPELPIYLQSGSDLGMRMGKAFLESFARWPGQPILLTGSDIPSYSPDLARQAAALLNEADCVLIPTRDGGYCTIGFRDPG
ncbi:MAG: DUF2064 domain-containing protein, partial [Leptospiraceae bacterium]|nr:DUF2064 domain-containing protein [Leptospiraceae bacterium]